ncbi:hypothetical protein HNP38_002837 [Chryseobacterium defluvii]|uniref:Uncharacterized protein n=1 Tax=Chryseobacterium defluvii TaxID=160396 RepID=A0A840KDQ4_9FLAO|nr:hypothetical protein [Chryseobacterium defluvii]
MERSYFLFLGFLAISLVSLRAITVRIIKAIILSIGLGSVGKSLCTGKKLQSIIYTDLYFADRINSIRSLCQQIVPKLNRTAHVGIGIFQNFNNYIKFVFVTAVSGIQYLDPFLWRSKKELFIREYSDVYT